MRLQNIKSCGKYVYTYYITYKEVPSSTGKGITTVKDKLVSLMYDTEKNIMHDITEETGKEIRPYYFYNNKVYFFIYGDSVKIFRANLDYSDTELAYENKLSGKTYPIADSFFNILFDDDNKSLGFVTQNAETGETLEIYNKSIGHTVFKILYVDDRYIYFASVDNSFIIGKNERMKLDVINHYGGIIYRMNRDGTDCREVYNNKEANLDSDRMFIMDNLVFMGKIQFEDKDAKGYVYTLDSGKYYAELDKKGNIINLRKIEVVG